MNIRSKRLSRRILLRGASVTLGLPFLDVMRPGSVFAQAQAPRRLIYWSKPNGMYPQYFFPQKTGAGYDLPRIIAPIGEVPGLQDHVSVLSGVSNLARVSEPHSSGTTAILTTQEIVKPKGVEVTGISVDQVAANYLQSNGVSTPVHSLVLGGEAPKTVCGGNRSTGVYCSALSWSSNTTPVPREFRPQEAFRSITENLGVAPTEQRPLTVWERPEAKQSVLHYVNEEAGRLRLQLGTRDKAKLDEYLTSVSELERRVTATAALPASAACGNVDPIAQATSYVDEHQQMIDMMVLAAKCDLTRVMTFMIGNGASSRQYRHIGLNSNYHPFSHHNGNAQKLENYAKASTYDISLFAGFLGKLMNEVDVDGNSLLHNSTVFLSTDVQSGMQHGTNNMPTLIAGRGGGTLDTGKYVVYPDRVPMANVHTALLRTIGLDMNFGKGVTGPASGILA